MHWQLIHFIIKIGISLTPVGLFYVFYFKNFVFSRSRLLSLAPFFWGILSSVLTVLFQWLLPDNSESWQKAFLYAALIEESIRMAFLCLMIWIARENFTITEGIFDGVMIGLGFAFAENLHYAFNIPGNIVFLRTISSVPLHVFASGIMGYFLGYLILNQNPAKCQPNSEYLNFRNIRFALLALGLPILLHGLYDYSLLERGNLIYAVPLLLIGSFIFLEYLIDAGRLIFGRNILKMLKINADDVAILIKQQNYERWVSNRQKVGNRPRLFNTGWMRWQFFVALFFLLLATGLAFLIHNHHSIMISFADLNQPALIALFVLYPLTVFIILMLDAKINYAFFRDINSHVPQTALVNVRPLDITDGSTMTATDKQSTVSYHDQEQFTFVMDILPTGVFLPIQENWPVGTRLSLEFGAGTDQTILVPAFIQWSNQYNKTMPLGFICHMGKKSWSFLKYRALYHFKKITKIPVTYRNLIKRS